MKEKLTLSVDRAAALRLKTYTRRNGVSLSQIVEDQFKRLGNESFADRCYGQFKVPAADPNDLRLTYLRKKCLGLAN